MVTTVWLYGFPVSNFESIGSLMSPLFKGLSFRYKLNASFLCCTASCLMSGLAVLHCYSVKMMFSLIRPSIISFFDGNLLPFFEWNHLFASSVHVSYANCLPSSSLNRNYDGSLNRSLSVNRFLRIFYPPRITRLFISGFSFLNSICSWKSIVASGWTRIWRNFLFLLLNRYF